VRDKTQPPAFAEVHDATERAIELLNRAHGHRVHHLLMELGVRLRRVEPVLHSNVRVVQIDGLKPHGYRSRRVYIDDFNAAP
jgi:hypothetical protein